MKLTLKKYGYANLQGLQIEVFDSDTGMTASASISERVTGPAFRQHEESVKAVLAELLASINILEAIRRKDMPPEGTAVQNADGHAMGVVVATDREKQLVALSGAPDTLIPWAELDYAGAPGPSRAIAPASPEPHAEDSEPGHGAQGDPATSASALKQPGSETAPEGKPEEPAPETVK